MTHHRDPAAKAAVRRLERAAERATTPPTRRLIVEYPEVFMDLDDRTALNVILQATADAGDIWAVRESHLREAVSYLGFGRVTRRRP